MSKDGLEYGGTEKPYSVVYSHVKSITNRNRNCLTNNLKSVKHVLNGLKLNSIKSVVGRSRLHDP